MRHLCTAPLLAASLLVACLGSGHRPTLAGLHEVEADVKEVRVEDGLEQAMHGYRTFLETTPESSLTPEAMRRLADLKIEKEYGILGDGELVELPLPSAGAPAASRARPPAHGAEVPASGGADFELQPPAREELAWSGPQEAIELYDEILLSYPDYEHNDEVLYQKARAYDELGRTDEAIAVMERLLAAYPGSRYADEVSFRRAEYFFVRKRYLEAEEAYGAVTRMGPGSEYYELARYKLGWTFYKQQLHEEALDEYIALLDYKVSTGYDFDPSRDEASGRRIADTFRVISLSFSNLGGPSVLGDYFAEHGSRSYEDRIYRHFGDFYLEKLRYHDAAAVYRAFVDLYPLHRKSPHFSMRVVEIFEKGGFPKLVLEAKKQFAARYGLESEYWQHFALDEAPDVVAYLKTNLEDLATHYHALYQDEALADQKPANFAEALHWYRDYLASFPDDVQAPSVHYQLADLLLEHRDFGQAAREYERTAYAYPSHAQAAAAGYAAIYAHREHQKQVTEEEQAAVRRAAVASTLRFVDTFPHHEHAAVVLGAAVDDLFEMKEFEQAIAIGRRLIEIFPDADPAIRRSAWTVVGHASFELSDYEAAEGAYARVLETTPAGEESHQALTDNLAAAIYKQGEQAGQRDDHRLAADHFLRIARVAPGSEIRPAAEYDAGAALIRLEDWVGAASVLEAFRRDHPDHPLREEATKQIALVYRKGGELARAAREYERVASEADEDELRREALLLAGELYEDARLADRALEVYLGYVRRFPRPLELAVETHFKIAALHGAAQDRAAQHEQLRKVVEIDAAAGAERTDRIRVLAARSALVLSEELYGRFGEVRLVQPFEPNLREKQRRMDAALAAFRGLVDYQVGDVTAAATFYMAQLYSDFSRALLESERPTDLDAAELQDYELALEEESFPFEERAIEVHEKNLELMAADVYNPWIEKSLRELAELMPGRYAKFEESSGFIASIDRYAYRLPSAAAPATDESGSDATPESDEPSVRSDPGAAPGSQDLADGSAVVSR